MIECRDCGEVKPSSEYYYRKESGKYRTDCKECVRAKRSKYRKENPEVVNAANRKCYATRTQQYRDARAGMEGTKWVRRSASCNNRASAIGAKGRITSDQVRRMFESHGHMCYYCDKILDVETKDACVEHVTPMSRGGLNVIQNCVPSCRPCNARKGNRKESEFK